VCSPSFGGSSRSPIRLPGWCQSNANRSPNSHMMRVSCRQLTPFEQGRRAILLKDVAAV
jgi:hypothetical protein